LFSPPPRAFALSGWALLPLRAFLGFTFCFAGLQKLANPNFFNASDPSGIQAQLIASARLSPLHTLLGHLIHLSTPVGILIALAEVAVGLGTLLGLWTRAAAIGGMILSITLFLTISYHSSPYYTGADIVFVFAWMPLVLAGAGGVLSLDAAIAGRARREAGLAPPTVVPVEFSVVQQVCGSYKRGRCAARGGATCDPAPCPFLRNARAAGAGDVRDPDSVERRTLVLGGGAVVAAGALGLLGAGAVAGIGRAAGGAPALKSSGAVSLGSNGSSHSGSAPRSASSGSGSSGSSSSHPAGTAIGPARDVPVGGAASFTDPSSGDPALVIQVDHGHFVAYDAICPHAGCTVGWSGAANLIVCPCHGSEFNPANGNVETGPAPRGLGRIAVAEGADGKLYVDG